jgi:hypothetical protein
MVSTNHFRLPTAKQAIRRVTTQVLWLMPIILATDEAEIGRNKIQGQPRHKVRKTPSQRKSWMWWHASVNPAKQGSTNRRTVVQANPSIE